MRSICVFCGSSTGNQPQYIEATKLLGRALAEKKIKMVYGGGRVGLMGVAADSVLQNGGEVVGVFPRFLDQKERAHPGLTELILCETMHERKTAMFERAEGFIALPGGFGTLEEIVEVLTWQQLGLHRFPVAFLNIDGFYDHLRQLFSQMEATQFLKPEHKSMALFETDPHELLEIMERYQPIDVKKWIEQI